MKLIDADKVAEAIEWLDIYDFVIWHDVQECIDKVPAVDAEPVRHGQWEWDGYVYDMLWRCSECSCLNEYDSNYCPECGAKMDKLTMVQVKPSDKEFTLYADEKPILTFKDGKIVLHGERREDANN